MEFPDPPLLSLSLSLSHTHTYTHTHTYPYYLLPLAGLIVGILCPHKADVSESLLVSQHWHISVLEFIREHLRMHSFLKGICIMWNPVSLGLDFQWLQLFY